MVANVAIRAAFERQARACDDLGSPFTARLCRLAADQLSGPGEIASLVEAWPETRVVADALALRFCGALHALKRQGYAPLAAVYPPQQADDGSLWQAVEQALSQHHGFIATRMESAPQTNEVRRSAALFPAFAAIAARFPGKPLILSEVGASAGLNLLWDRFGYRFDGTDYLPASGEAPFTTAPDWSGPLPPHAAITVKERAGCDLNPLSAQSPEDCERLLSYIWADQADRLERTEKALQLARETDITVEKADAVSWLDERLAAPRSGAVHVVYHTIAWQYLPDHAQREGLRLIAEAGARAGEDAPLCHLAMEADNAGRGAGLTLTVWPDGETHALGRADFHGRWVEWQGLA
ncbi:DUF2332 domain-containing protein [Martelella endophytica]|uniref:DUF2332 domain-containing protein n=1 Tax=Martelella endophytica TaxID=1486262 RepID=A0A0D5LMQ7_MAREN|nr:DUF2332 family protein [Martelella endophytica]AJY44598.1 hypothetical protein TM49_01145 [Martelella endophytica]